MMTNRAKKKKDKYGKLKVAAIPVLTLVLLYVLWGNLQDSDSLAAPSQSITTGQVVDQTEAVQTSGRPPGLTNGNVEPWPEPDLAFLEDESLFRSFRQPSEADPEPVLASTTVEPKVDPQRILAGVAEELKRETVPFAFRSRKKNVVMFGNRLLKVGEEIRDNVFVRSINDNNLVLEYRSSEQVD